MGHFVNGNLWQPCTLPKHPNPESPNPPPPTKKKEQKQKKRPTNKHKTPRAKQLQTPPPSTQDPDALDPDVRQGLPLGAAALHRAFADLVGKPGGVASGGWRWCPMALNGTSRG